MAAKGPYGTGPWWASPLIMTVALAALTILILTEKGC